MVRLQTEKRTRRGLLSLLAAMPYGLLFCDEQGKVFYANPAAGRYLAHPVAELVHLSIDEALAEIGLRAKEPERLINALQIVSHLQPVEIELTVASPGDKNDAPDAFYRLAFFPVDEKGVRGLVVHDVTGEHTADQLKNEFVAVVSHELRTPLSAMQGFSELLLTHETATPARRRVWLEMINRESVRLSSLLDDLLSLGSIEAGRLELRIERVEVETLIRQCVEILQIGSSKHALTISIPEDLPAVRADRDKLIQVLNNVIGNAIKYSINGGEIKIRAEVSPESANCISISVTDQGIGIPETEISRIFEKFYRVPGNPREVKGTGLGLAITRKLIELMEGNIWVESERGKGSTFYITLPMQVFPAEELQTFRDKLLTTLLVSHKDSSEAELYLDYLQRSLSAHQLDEILRDVMYEVGDRWLTGNIGIGDEHFATNLMREFLSRARSQITTPGNGLRLIIGGVPGEEHVVGLAMVANAFARAGWQVTNLGANVPLSAYISTLEQVRPNVLLLSMAMSQRLIEVKRVVQEVRELFPDLIIGIGGRVFTELPDLAQRLQVNFHGTTPEETVRLAARALKIRSLSGNDEHVGQN
jgi:signal transduction histidine kinase/methanogenic corrinoid protein MtbC1